MDPAPPGPGRHSRERVCHRADSGLRRVDQRGASGLACRAHVRGLSCHAFALSEASDAERVGAAALTLLIADPQSLFGASFQMTFLCVGLVAGVGIPLLERT